MKWITLLFGLGLIACHSCDTSTKAPSEVALNHYSLGESMVLGKEIAPPPSFEAPYENDPSPGFDDAPKLMIIKSGNMSLQVDDLDKAKQRIDSIGLALGGYYQREDYYSLPSETGYQLDIRIPVTKFDGMIKAFSVVQGKVTSKNVNARDVTEEYMDLELRLANSEEYISRYLKLLDKADSIKDMLVIQEKIRVLEEEIESKKGRIRYLKNQVAYSSLQLHLVKYYKVMAESDDDHFGHELGSAFIKGYNSVLYVLLMVIRSWPLILSFGFIFWWAKKHLGHRQKQVTDL